MLVPVPLILLALLLGDQPAASEEASEETAEDPALEKVGKVEKVEKVAKVEKIDEIVVRAARVERSALEIPAAVGIVEKEQIQLARQQLSLGESLSGVAGVFTQNRQNFAQDLRISIRGFGSRARFGIRGIKLLIDGIPATLPDGQGQVDTLQLATAGRIEVMRGPSATLYGSAAGGVIRIESETVPDVPDVQGRVAFGSNGFRSYELKGAGRAGPVGILAGLTRQEMGGYREHSRMETNVFNGKVDWAIDDRSELSGILRVVYSPIADDPGGLNEVEKWQDRRQAAPRNLRFDVGERLGQVTTGLRYRRNLGEKHETTAAAWFGYRDFANRLPFDGQCTDGGPPGGASVALDRFFTGGSLQYVYRDEIASLPNELLVGFDVEVQRDDRKRRCLYDTGEGRHTLLQDENVTSVRGFLQDELGLPADLELVFGVGFDALFYRVDDRLVTPSDPDDSGSRDFTEWSPMLAMTWRPERALNAWWRISTSFEPPSTTELRNPVGGGFDQDLEPQRAVNFELGAKGIVSGRLRYEVVAYYVEIRNELIPVDLMGDTFFRNAAKTWRTGIETGLTWEIANGLTARAAYTFTTAEFDRASDLLGNSLAGNQIPGVPEQLLSIDLAWRHRLGFFAGIQGRYVGTFYANDANTVEADSYGVVDLRAGWEIEIGSWLLMPHVGVNNILDQTYDDNVRINATAGRYFEPAPEIEVYGGVTLAYRFGES
ncbi:MAG: TonB-dependent receptor [Deltaproteobacteria bacterium]|nr:TonB-dependent receptor [Deltaproteobacteria bacterium]